jgi:catechol 2,3-dioxygenase-like lactoylglutathione lyase family enzyme
VLDGFSDYHGWCVPHGDALRKSIVQQDQTNRLSRRQVLQLAGAAAAGLLGADVSEAADLPLNNTGLEHIGMQIPDQEAAAKLYGLIFDPQLFQEKDPPPRFYVKVGISYIAFGGLPANAEKPGPRIDHFCALVQDYKPQEMRAALGEAGITMATGPGMIADPDGVRLQLLGVPGGLARTIIPSRRVSQEEPAVQAIGFDHIVLNVTDMEKTAAFYRKFFGTEVSRSKKPESVSFAAAKTRLVLEPSAGKTPGVDRISIKVAGFKTQVVTEKLKKLGVDVIASNEKDAVRFKDPNGFVMELKAAV